MGLWQRCIVVLFGQINIWSFLPGWVTKDPPLVNRSPWEMPEITVFVVFRIIFFITFSCGCVCRSEDNLLESSFSFYHVDPGTELWVSDWGKHRHPLSHHAGLCFKLLDWASQSLPRFLRSLQRSSAVSAEHWSSSNSPEPVRVSHVTLGQRTRAGTGRRWGTKQTRGDKTSRTSGPEIRRA